MPKLLFVTRRAFYPDCSGGAEQSSLYLFQSLQKLGWEIEVICRVSLRSQYFWRGCWRILKREQPPSLSVVDNDLGYPCWRWITKFGQQPQWIEFLNRRLEEYQPDIVLGHDQPNCPLLINAAERGYPSFYFARNLGNIETGEVIPEKLHTIANSPYTAEVASQVSTKEIGVVLPFMKCDRYRVQARQRRYITFINPIPEKGVDVVLEIARHLPQERFLFVKGQWPIYGESALEAFVKPARELPNVDIWEHQADMRQVYAMTDVLLVPSQFTETFGRVIVEAQVNGIPVVTAKAGGIPYTVGRGGVLIDPKDNVQAYVEALTQLRQDQDHYAELSDLARKNSQRTEFDPQYQVKNFIQFVESRIQQDGASKLIPSEPC
ncbi:MAG: glycosyltransferase [Leptolyngbyaceae cyanobacterium MO_188.B28]|nr:glycosyltransferase [Leptolyngbyaceae cyanobacterium MO_188.B28]